MLKTVLEAVALGSFLITGALAPAAAQVRRQEYAIVWYTDDTYTTISGQRIVFCDGGQFRTGTPTLYEEELYYGCN